MARPQKHRKTGIYWFRIRVPDDLRPFVRRTEITRTLETRDPAEAAIKHRRVAAEIAAQWDNYRKGVQELSQKQMQALAGVLYREMIAANEKNPGRPEDWEAKLQSDIYAIEARMKRRGALIGRFGQIAYDFLDRQGVRLSTDGEAKFMLAVAEAVVQGNKQLLRNARGDYRPDPDAERFPELDLDEKEGRASQSLVQMYEVYAAHVKHAPSTIKRWTPKVRQFEEWIAPTSWHLATKKQVIAWQDELLKSIAPRTVRDVHFASNKALYRWLEEREWCENPFKGVRVRMPKYEEELRDKELSEAEARIILHAALGPMSPRLTPAYRAAFRWVPWICAYTGARVNEITQLRKQDVRMVEGGWVFRITPEAGRVKTGGTRDVPVHPHLVEMGLIDFVKKHAAGPLFYDPERYRGGGAANPPYKKVGGRIAAWVRKIGVDDPAVAPNHGWRHRMSSILMGLRARKVEIDAILGHKGPRYGKVEMRVRRALIESVPRIEIGLLAPSEAKPMVLEFTHAAG